MSSHRIHLKGPWEYHWSPPESANSKDAAEGSVNMPRDWHSLFGDRAGTAQFRRPFHRPTNLDSHEQVFIVLTEVRGDGTIFLNDIDVGMIHGIGRPVEFEVTSLLKSFNQLMINLHFDPVSSAGAPGGLFGAVALDIRSQTAI